MTGFTLEPLTAADADFRWAVFAATIKPYIDELFDRDEARQRAMITDQLAAGAHRAIVVDGERAGIVLIEETAEAISLSQIEILPAYQGRGIGTALVHSLIERAVATGKPVHLSVFHANGDARRLYERLGFRQVAETAHDVQMAYTPPGPGGSST
jgi:ribosomal protein S18 acetylase RimI-like enzyme